MCDKQTLDRFRQVFNDYCNVSVDGADNGKSLASTLIKILLSILIKLMFKIIKQHLEE